MSKTFENLRTINQYILRKCGQIMVYGWNSEKLSDEIMQAFKVSEMKIDLSELTSEEMESLFFGKFNASDATFLLPIWIYPFLSEEDKIKVGDTDNRGGCLWYSVTPHNNKK